MAFYLAFLMLPALTEFTELMGQIAAIGVRVADEFDKAQQSGDNTRSKCMLGLAGGPLRGLFLDT